MLCLSSHCFKTIQAQTSADVDSSEEVFGNRGDVVTGQPLSGCVGDEVGLLSRGIIDTHKAAFHRDPEATGAIQIEVLHSATGQAICRREQRETSISVAR